MHDIHEYVAELVSNDYIDPNLYTKFNVKRGLRNTDGSGVLVGLTRIGDVHAYIIDEGEIVPVDGKLYYRGVDVQEIVHNAEAEKRLAFEEAVYLLLFGRLPTQEQLDSFCTIMGENRILPPSFAEDAILKLPSPNIMNKLARSILALYAYDAKPEDHSPENVLRQCIEILARFPTIVAYAYRAKKHYYDRESLIIHPPEFSCHSAETILSLIRPDQQFTRLEAEILDLALVLHAEHGGGNNSTFTVHVVSSADTDIYSAIAAGISSLKGSKHGGANEKVMGMMESIKQHVRHWDSEGEVADYLTKILRAEAYDHSGLIYGQGHAVYTKSDPRAVLLRNKAALLVAERADLHDEFNLYQLIERLVPELFRKFKNSDKDICSNIDFYSGFVYKMLTIPPELYVPLFAVSRMVGWCAHHLEEIVSGGRIIRPAYKCVQKRLAYTKLSERTASED